MKYVCVYVAGVNGTRRVGQNVTRSDLHEQVICACAMEIALVHSLTIVASERVQGLSWSQKPDAGRFSGAPGAGIGYCIAFGRAGRGKLFSGARARRV